MRLTEFEIQSIKETFVECFGKDDHLWLFGSRTDPQKRGGDIDLYIETPTTEKDIYYRKKIDFSIKVQDKIEEQKIDIIINFLPEKKDAKIYQEARRTGILMV
jgi:hypothetical protein